MTRIGAKDFNMGSQEDDFIIQELQKDIQELRSMVDLKEARIHAKIDSISKDIEHLQSRMKSYITIERYSPVEKIVISGVGLILVLVVTLIIKATFESRGL